MDMDELHSLIVDYELNLRKLQECIVARDNASAEYEKLSASTKAAREAVSVSIGSILKAIYDNSGVKLPYGFWHV